MITEKKVVKTAIRIIRSDSLECFRVEAMFLYKKKITVSHGLGLL